MTTRDKDDIVQPMLHPTLLLTELESTSYKLALKDPRWFAAMKAENAVLINNNTLELYTSPYN